MENCLNGIFLMSFLVIGNLGAPISPLFFSLTFYFALVCIYYIFFWDGYAEVASDGPGEYPVISESRAGSDEIGATVTPTNVAYVTTGGISLSLYIYIY